MATVPYAFARVVPKVARFDNEWLPRARSHWAWFLLMVVVVLVVHVSTCWFMHVLNVGQGRPGPLLQGHVTATKLILLGLTVVSLGRLPRKSSFAVFYLSN